jgi:hypothetical protein
LDGAAGRVGLSAAVLQAATRQSTAIEMRGAENIVLLLELNY